MSKGVTLIAVVGLNSLQYFWTRRTPEGSARDLERILNHYLSRWKKERVILAGYSLGAEVLPFMASRLPGDLLVRVQQIALLGPGRKRARTISEGTIRRLLKRSSMRWSTEIQAITPFS